jgi:creatinine amidohydrolase
MPRSKLDRLRTRTKSEVCYERLRPAQVVARRTACALAYLPLGIIEWHGLQNPLGLDGLHVHQLCVRAAVRGGGLVFPVAWYGGHRESNLAEANRPISAAIAKLMGLPADNFAPGYMGGGTTLEHAELYLRLLFHIFYQIRSLGFTAIYVLVGHGPLKAYVVLAGGLFERATGVKVGASYARDLVPGTRGDHAGRTETGTMMALCPELVDLGALAPGPKTALVGIDGDDPRTGSRRVGAAFIKKCVPALAIAGRELLARKASDGSMSVR